MFVQGEEVEVRYGSEGLLEERVGHRGDFEGLGGDVNCGESELFRGKVQDSFLPDSFLEGRKTHMGVAQRRQLAFEGDRFPVARNSLSTKRLREGRKKDS